MALKLSFLNLITIDIYDSKEALYYISIVITLTIFLK